MAYYLQMDGVDDLIKTPSITINTIEIDCLIDSTQNESGSYILDARSGLSNGHLTTGEKGAGLTTLLINGSSGSVTDIPRDTRTTIKASSSSVFTDNVNIFSSYIDHAECKGNIYSVKCYNGTTLVAHYDMTTGTVQDQSGNGKHATLTGGTWIEDAPSGTDVNYSYLSKQVIYSLPNASYYSKQIIHATRSLDNLLRQSIFEQRSQDLSSKQVIFDNTLKQNITRQEIYSYNQNNYRTKQVIHKDIVLDYDSKQVIYAEISLSQSTRQMIYENKIDLFSTKQIIYKDATTVSGLRQLIHALRSANYTAKQIIYDENKIIVSEISLTGERTLTVYLIGSRELSVFLEGSI